MKRADARITKTKASAVHAVKEIVAARGLVGLSHSEVAKVSGISRATLYRHWPELKDLVSLCLEDFQLSVDFPHGSDLVWDIATGAHTLADQLTGDFSKVLRHVWGIDQDGSYKTDHLFKAAVRKLQACYLYHRPAVEIAEHEWSLSMSMLAGPIFLRWLLRIEPLADQDYIALAQKVISLLDQVALPVQE